MSVYWINGSESPHLAIVRRPEGDHSLDDEMLRLKQSGIETLVSLLERFEAELLGLREEGSRAARAGLRFLAYPIPDAHVPSDEAAFRAFVQGIAGRLAAGEHVGVHCRGCIGRATVTAACALIHLGWNPAAALSAIEKARGWPVPDTEEQQAWILRYKAEP